MVGRGAGLVTLPHILESLLNMVSKKPSVKQGIPAAIRCKRLFELCHHLRIVRQVQSFLLIVV